MLVAALATSATLLAACGAGSATEGAAPSVVPSSYAPTTVTLVAHDSFALTESLLADFTARSGITVSIVSAGDAGEMVNKAALTAGNPEGDVLVGVDNTLLSRAVQAGVFDPYVSPAAADVPAELRASTSEAVTPVDYGDVCVNIDDAWYADRGLQPPATLADLALPAYRDQLVVENAATSSPGLAFLLATIARYGEDGYEQYWRSLRANGVKVVNGWTEAYEGEYTAAGEGTRPLVVSYASSPPVEIVYASDPKPTKPYSSVMESSCYRQVEYAGVLAGTEHEEEAGAVVDFLLSKAFQDELPLSMYVFPVTPEAELPEVFVEHAARPEDVLELPPEEIGANRERWIDEWTDIVLR